MRTTRSADGGPADEGARRGGSGTTELERGRERYSRAAWTEALESFTRAEREKPLAPDDIERLATAAYMLGHEADYLEHLERAYHGHLEANETAPALRCAFWIGVHLARRGEMGRGSGWLGRAQRILEREPGDRVERGYLLLPVVFEQEGRGDWEAAASTAGEAAGIGERFDDPDLFALGAHEQGHILIRSGRFEEGLRLLDEAMVAVTAGELSPIVSGIVYCGVILACQDAYATRRAREWTGALTRWCERQPDLVAFTGRCLIHRAELMQLGGTWADALDEARRARERSLEAENEAAAGEACYREGEIHRLIGDLGAAEEAYRRASRHGWEPQPGLALLRLAQGKPDAAAATIRRVAAETRDASGRARLLPAYVEIMLATGDLDEARGACAELEGIAEGQGSTMLEALAASARGAVELADGDAAAALVELRRGWQSWETLDAPYEAARVRILVGLACRALGDEDAATLELDAARSAFEELGASTDLGRVDELAGRVRPTDTHGLTDRELEVLRLVAAGKSNREIAEQLVISEHTVARHLQNIFAKIGVSSRTAASAFAFEHDLV